MSAISEEDAEDPPQLATYGDPVDLGASSIVERQLKLEQERCLKIPGFECSHQQTLAVPGTSDFILAVTLFKISESMSMSKLVKTEGQRSGFFDMYGKIEDDDLLKPGEYMEVGVYQDVNYNSEGQCHYKCVHTFLVPSPVKFWYLVSDQKTAKFYDVLIAS